MTPPPSTSTITRLLSTPSLVFTLSLLFRALLFLYGIYQDAHSPLKYTDIDYYVFTDAARYISQSKSPYDRATYRYTPLLAWLLLPTTWPGKWWFQFGKIVFIIGDIIAGWLIYLILQMGKKEGGVGMNKSRAIKYASIWLLNPIVATISTRGSSESLLAVMVMGLLWAVLKRKMWLAGGLLGLSVHFKIYPFIYGASIMWYLDDTRSGTGVKRRKFVLLEKIDRFMNPARKVFLGSSLATFLILNVWMYYHYQHPFLQQTYLHHLTRTDHRHNFSAYNTLLYLTSSTSSSTTSSSKPHLSSLAFIPQLTLSTILIPLSLSKKNLPSTMLAQTFAFVTFNKVVTSQYFIWYILLLPLHLPNSTLLPQPHIPHLHPYKGPLSLLLYILLQTLWLHRAYSLEFLGKSTFLPGLWIASLLFFIVNIWILGGVVDDIRGVERGEGGGEGREGEGRGGGGKEGRWEEE